MQKRNAMILQQIETVTELLDELRDYEKKKPSERPAKKQIHFSDSSDTHNERLDSFSSETSGKSSSSAFKSALKNEPLNILPSRRQRKSIMSNCSMPEAEVSSFVAVDKVTHLLSKYIYLKKHLEWKKNSTIFQLKSSINCKTEHFFISMHLLLNNNTDRLIIISSVW